MVCMFWKPYNTLINRVSVSKNSIPYLHWYLFHPNHVLKLKPYFFSTINSLVLLLHKLQITIHNSYFWLCFCLKNKIGMTFRSFLFEGLVLILSTYESSIDVHQNLSSIKTSYTSNYSKPLCFTFYVCFVYTLFL